MSCTSDCERLYDQQQFQQIIDRTHTTDDPACIYWRLLSLRSLGDYDQFIESYTTYQPTLIEYPEYDGMLQYHLMLYYWCVGQLDKTLELSHQALQSFEDVYDDRMIGHTLHMLAATYDNMGDYQKSQEVARHALEIFLRHDDFSGIIFIYHQFAYNYYVMGDFPKAKENLLKALGIAESTNNIPYHEFLFDMMARICFAMNLPDEAYDYLERGKQEFEKNQANNSYKMGIARYWELQIELAVQTDREQAKKMLDQYEQGLEAFHHPRRARKAQKLKYLKALYYKYSKRMRNKVKGEILFRKLLEEPNFRRDLTLTVLGHLIEMLIQEFKTYEEGEVLEEIFAFIDEMFQVATDQNLYRYQIRALIIKCKMNAVLNQYDAAFAQLAKARGIAEKYEYGNSLEEINEIENRIKANFVELQDIVKSHQQLSQNMEQLKLLEYVKKAQNIQG